MKISTEIGSAAQLVGEEKAVEYVVLHEMCHLIYMNHSKNFWNLVEKNMPNYKEYKKLLA